MSRKLDDYFDAGVRLVWFVDLRQRTVDVFTAKDECETLDERRTLTGGDVLPGFKLPLKKLVPLTDSWVVFAPMGGVTFAFSKAWPGK